MKKGKNIFMLPGIAILLLSLIAGSRGGTTIGEEKILSSANDLKMEIDRRQEDIQRIDERIDNLKQKMDEYAASLSTVNTDYSGKLYKVRKLIIFQDKIAKGNFLNLIASSDSFNDILISMRTYKQLMDTEVSELSEVSEKRKTLQKEMETLQTELANLNEIKILLEKRKKELNNQLHIVTKPKFYI